MIDSDDDVRMNDKNDSDVDNMKDVIMISYKDNEVLTKMAITVQPISMIMMAQMMTIIVVMILVTKKVTVIESGDRYNEDEMTMLMTDMIIDAGDDNSDGIN